MNKIVKFIIAGVLVVGVITYLLVTGLSGHSVYYLEVSELMKDPTQFDAKGARISGDVASGSIVKGSSTSHLLKFKLADTTGASMDVEYTGVVPDAFKEDVNVIVEGRYDPEKKVFYAKKLLAKCPSKYDAEDPHGHPDNISM